MKNTKRVGLIPQYLSQFNCTGSSCEDTCCSGWTVSVDKDTYKKYKKERDNELKSKIDENLKRNRVNQSDNHYASIKMDSQGACPFLNGEKLCSIQLKNGEESLSNTCATYPRISNVVNHTVETSGTVSCPEIARLVLFNQNGIEFDDVEMSSKTRLAITHSPVDTESLANKNKPQRYFWELRIFTIGLLQNRQYSITERMIIMGMFYSKAQDYIDNGNIHSIPSLIEEYNNLTQSGAFRSFLDKLPAKTNVQIGLLQEISKSRFKQGVVHQRYLQCYTEFMDGLGLTDTSITSEDRIKRYEDAYENYYAPYMTEKEYVLENYLVNYVFKNLFPFGGFDKIFDDYVLLVVTFSLLKLHLIGMSAYHKELNDEIVLKFIQSFGRVIEHSSSFLRSSYEYLVENKYNNMAYMAVLLKN